MEDNEIRRADVLGAALADLATADRLDALLRDTIASMTPAQRARIADALVVAIEKAAADTYRMRDLLGPYVESMLTEQTRKQIADSLNKAVVERLDGAVASVINDVTKAAYEGVIAEIRKKFSGSRY